MADPTPQANSPDGAPDFLHRYADHAEAALDALLPPAKTEPVELHTAMRYSTLGGGKRVRAALVYATGQTLGASLDALDGPACAVELIHAYSLIHDDLPCMDDDDLRRGKPTCHKAFDEATALLAGDGLQSLAFESVANHPGLTASAEQRLEMNLLLARAAGSLGMAGGQALDLAATGKSLTLAQMETVHRLKTGALIETSVQLGALAAGESRPKVLEHLRYYGQCVGLAFQIVDDILDIEGDTATLGKTAGADEAMNKSTYPKLLGLEGARDRARQLLEEALASLQSLGDNAENLRALARFILDRQQ
ncbi:MAG: (2E,6E)-farnesyl diphosphate synthase [Gammaproteobacteria bacterium]|nr:(2E,6E)-farnesyl diphosphate synthase [Gammaproteobacteria bacterium]